MLETARLILRPYEDRDAEDCFAFLSDRETCYLDGGYEPYTAMDEAFWCQVERFKNKPNRFMLERRDTGRVIGTIIVREDRRRAVPAREIGYVLAPAHRGQGYMREAVQAVILHLFAATDTVMITAGAIARNRPSQRLLKALGFTREGVIRKGGYYPGDGAVDMISFYLEKEGRKGLVFPADPR